MSGPQKESPETLAQLRFLSDLSHELGTPLSLIRSTLDILRRRLPLETDPDTKRCLDILDQNTLRLSELTQNFISISKIYLGGEGPALTLLDMTQFLQGLCDHISGSLALRNCTITLCDGTPHLTLKSDPFLLERILFNLITNAFRHGKATNITLITRQKDGKFTLSVQDDGKGIAPEIMDTLFQRYTSNEGITRSSGIGLSLTRSFTEHLGGTIRCANTPGSGACFTVEFPLDDQLHQTLHTAISPYRYSEMWLSPGWPMEG